MFNLHPKKLKEILAKTKSVGPGGLRNMVILLLGLGAKSIFSELRIFITLTLFIHDFNVKNVASPDRDSNKLCGLSSKVLEQAGLSRATLEITFWIFLLYVPIY